jgi:glycosyltransferase involved in cell wall biosynthesis
MTSQAAAARPSRPRIAIFQSNWPLQVHTTNMVDMLVARGYDVDLFLHGVSQDFASLSAGVSNQHVAVISPLAGDGHAAVRHGPVNRGWRDSPTFRFVLAPLIWSVRAVRAAREAATFAVSYKDLDHIIPPALRQATANRMRDREYRAMIGVEREGLIWAGEMAARSSTPLIYYSLELYTNAQPLPGTRFRRMKRLERRYHAKAAATIVQDEPRAKVLFEDNATLRRRVFYMPVSLTGGPKRARSHYLHDRLGLPAGQRIVLVLGQVHAKRYTHDALIAAQNFPEGWTLVVHGPAYGDRALLAELEALNTRGNAIISTDLIPEHELSDLVASADVGVAVYSPDTLNEYWTGRASEKVARYAQMGVPMIAFDYPSFREVFERFTCGRVIRDFSEFAAALEAISAEYERYRAGAFAAFSEVYDFNRHFPAVVDWIDQL